MQCPSPNSHVFSLVLLLNRASLGLYFLLAGYGKVTGEGGVKAFVEGGFKALSPSWLPEVIATPYGYAIPWLEIILGAMLVLGIFGRPVAALIGLMILSFTVALFIKNQSMVHGPGPFSANVIMVTLAAMLTVTGAGRYAVESLWCKGCKAKSES